MLRSMLLLFLSWMNSKLDSILKKCRLKSAGGDSTRKEPQGDASHPDTLYPLW